MREGKRVGNEGRHVWVTQAKPQAVCSTAPAAGCSAGRAQRSAQRVWHASFLSRTITVSGQEGLGDGFVMWHRLGMGSGAHTPNSSSRTHSPCTACCLPIVPQEVAFEKTPLPPRKWRLSVSHGERAGTRWQVWMLLETSETSETPAKVRPDQCPSRLLSRPEHPPLQAAESRVVSSLPTQALCPPGLQRQSPSSLVPPTEEARPPRKGQLGHGHGHGAGIGLAGLRAPHQVTKQPPTLSSHPPGRQGVSVSFPIYPEQRPGKTQAGPGPRD